MEAVTRFSVRSTNAQGHSVVWAEPLTGRTHQIRVHAAENGFPVIGDNLYGGASGVRLCLHAQQLVIRHPVTGAEQVFTVSTTFPADARVMMRQAFIDSVLTNAYRLVHGAADGSELEGWYLDRLGDYLLVAGDAADNSGGGSLNLDSLVIQHVTNQRLPANIATGIEANGSLLNRCVRKCTSRGIYLKRLARRIRSAGPAEISPRHVAGETAPESFTVLENGLQFEVSFNEGYSVGLFLDQRDNRRRLLVNHVASGFPLFPDDLKACRVLNTFAYTCAFSVCAAQVGSHTTSLDLSRKYLDWGKRNFALNGLDPGGHEFLCGDTFDWFRRLGKKQRRFEMIILDPPTFSQSKQSGVFRAEKDYGKLVAGALPLLASGGVLLASTNAAMLKPDVFLNTIEAQVRKLHRQVSKCHYVPQPPDFPITRTEPAYLKTVWLRIT